LVGCVALLALASCSSGKARAELLGFWERRDGKTASSVEFMADGAVVFGEQAAELLDSKVMKILRDFNLKPARNSMTFQVLDKGHVEIRADFTPLLEGLSAGAPPGSGLRIDVAEFRPRAVLVFAIADDELTLSSEKGKIMTFLRPH
jgi:hypothetical protein